MRTVSRAIACLALVLTAWLVPSRAHGHPLQFGSLQITEHADGTVRTVFRFSGTEADPGHASVVLPDGCRALGPPLENHDEVGLYRATRARCALGLSGRDVRVEGLEGRGCQVLVTVSRADGISSRGMIDSAAPVFRVPARDVPARVAPRYLVLGVEHILTGPDHLAFVAALLLLVRTRRRLLATVTAFTVGHSITLAAASLGLLRASPAPVEAAIALSILLVAHELAHPERDTLTRRSPWLVAGVFGLLHGLGFAGALASVGLPRGDVALALLAFNVGVEAGQIAFIAVAMTAAWGILRTTRVRPEAWQRAGTYAIGALSMYWLLNRVAAMAT